MGKKSREKRERKAPAKAAQKGTNAAGDLRLIEAHIDQHLKGVPEAETALRMMGRDAAVTIMQVAERKRNDELLEFGRKLVAVRPQVETNLMELREASVHEHAAKATKKAPLAVDATDLEVEWSTIALFDPTRLAKELAHGGRPRTDMARVGQGDIAWFALGPSRPTKVRFTVDPCAEPSALALRLRVDSGVVFVGPPEASDGPRMGAVRLDPFRTALDEHLARGGFVRLKEGLYDLFVRRPAEDEVVVHLSLAKDPAPLAIEKAALDLPPPAAAVGA